MRPEKYYIGLDMGTNSVGWAVTDEQYNLVRAKGKDMWGIREFESAEGAVERRTNRISRRRRQREVVRIGKLKNYFADAIDKVDPDFFQRLDNSKYHKEDKDENVRYKYGIFNDPDYNDADYYKQYPTIFHLRSELIDSTDEHDVRLVYLALLNMFKHRGHFLNASIGVDGSDRTMQDAYHEFCDTLSDLKEGVSFPEIDGKAIEDIMSAREYSRSRKAEELSALFGFTKKNKLETDLIKAMVGLKVDLKKIFPEPETEEKLAIEFSSSTFEEEKAPTIQALIGDENYELISVMKEIYDIGLLAGVLKGHTYLSKARVAEYDKHKADLARLKKVIKEYGTLKQFNAMFREDGAGSYSAYVNSFNTTKNGENNKQRRSMKGRSQEDFYKNIKKVLKGYPQNDDVISILAEVDAESFMPKQLTANNGVIPNQVHAREMKKILSNAEGYLPFLLEKNENGLTVSEQILQLFSFQIPYYVGPTSTNSQKNGGNGWVVRKEAGEVLPWNIEEKIDMEKTSEEFINRLVRECTYLSGEKVLPKSSLLYQRFCVLNEINNLKIDDHRIEPDLKQNIYNDLFLKGKRVTKKGLVKYLKAQGAITEEAQLSGIDIAINNSLSSYGKFLGVFGEDLKKDSCQAMVEGIIYYGTIYGDSKQMFKKALNKNYGDKLSEEQKKRILGFKFNDWGRLSKEFLQL